MEYPMLSEKYNKFIYRDYRIEKDDENIYLKYFFEIEGLEKFEPVLTILKKKFEFTSLESEIVKNIAFNIGIVEAISYWKATCSKYFCIECGDLNEEQKNWFKKLIYLGLGEFRYINQISVSQEDFVEIIPSGSEFKMQENENQLNDVIIPIGGGKDSNVTLELLKNSNYKRFGFRMNLEEISSKCAEIAGLEENDIIEIKRKIDPNLTKLNKQGFLNGHTPYSALVAFITYFIATILNKKYIALSNEDSANELNVEGEKINHQYSKSIEFENDFREYVTKFISPNGPEYFSMLRPINELQIAKLFSELEKYHSVFKSCNVGSKTKPWKWCCDCPKCLFTYIILSPFLYKEKLVKIFREDLFEKESLLATFIELCGYGKKKPFECVGTYEEIRYAISKTIQNINDELPILLKYYKENFESIDCDMLKFYNKNNNLPGKFSDILKNKLFLDNR